MELSGDGGYGFYPYHKHPDEGGIGGWFAFEIGRNEENEDSEANGCY